MNKQNIRPLWQGICLVAGGAIGAGMFALPLVSAGPWLVWSVAGLVVVCLMTYLACASLAKVNIAYVAQAPDNQGDKISFSVIVEQILGKRWALFNNLSIAFILMILMYAYSTAGANIVKAVLRALSLHSDPIPANWLSLAFVVVIATIVWLGTAMVSRLSLVLLVAMTLLFCIVSLGLSDSMDFSQSLIPKRSHHYLFAALPVYVTAFACAGLVPTLVQHFPTQQHKVFNSLLWGLGLTFVVYLLWLLITFGNAQREEFVQLASTGGGIAQLVELVAKETAQASLISKLTVFSHLAIISSFLGISLSLLHFVRDKFATLLAQKHSSVAVFISFTPPALASFFFPYGFVSAIGFAGAFVALSFFIIPGLLFKKAKKQALCSGNSWPATTIILFGCVILILKLGLIFKLLPVNP